jgi:hypothetical protein
LDYLAKEISMQVHLFGYDHFIGQPKTDSELKAWFEENGIAPPP